MSDEDDMMVRLAAEQDARHRGEATAPVRKGYRHGDGEYRPWPANVDLGPEPESAARSVHDVRAIWEEARARWETTRADLEQKSR